MVHEILLMILILRVKSGFSFAFSGIYCFTTIHFAPRFRIKETFFSPLLIFSL